MGRHYSIWVRSGKWKLQFWTEKEGNQSQIHDTGLHRCSAFLWLTLWASERATFYFWYSNWDTVTPSLISSHYVFFPCFMPLIWPHVWNYPEGISKIKEEGLETRSILKEGFKFTFLRKTNTLIKVLGKKKIVNIFAKWRKRFAGWGQYSGSPDRIEHGKNGRILITSLSFWQSFGRCYGTCTAHWSNSHSRLFGY